MEDIDFKFKVTRADFEEMCGDLFDRIKSVIDTVYASSEITPVSYVHVNRSGADTAFSKWWCPSL